MVKRVRRQRPWASRRLAPEPFHLSVIGSCRQYRIFCTQVAAAKTLEVEDTAIVALESLESAIRKLEKDLRRSDAKPKMPTSDGSDEWVRTADQAQMKREDRLSAATRSLLTLRRVLAEDETDGENAAAVAAAEEAAAEKTYLSSLAVAIHGSRMDDEPGRGLFELLMRARRILMQRISACSTLTPKRANSSRSLRRSKSPESGRASDRVNYNDVAQLQVVEAKLAELACGGLSVHPTHTPAPDALLQRLASAEIEAAEVRKSLLVIRQRKERLCRILAASFEHDHNAGLSRGGSRKGRKAEEAGDDDDDDDDDEEIDFDPMDLIDEKEAARFFLLAHAFDHLHHVLGFDFHGKIFYDLSGSGGQAITAAMYLLPDAGKLNIELGRESVPNWRQEDASSSSSGSDTSGDHFTGDQENDDDDDGVLSMGSHNNNASCTSGSSGSSVASSSSLRASSSAESKHQKGRLTKFQLFKQKKEAIRRKQEELALKRAQAEEAEAVLEEARAEAEAAEAHKRVVAAAKAEARRLRMSVGHGLGGIYDEVHDDEILQEEKTATAQWPFGQSYDSSKTTATEEEADDSTLLSATSSLSMFSAGAKSRRIPRQQQIVQLLSKEKGRPPLEHETASKCRTKIPSMKASEAMISSRDGNNRRKKITPEIVAAARAAQAAIATKKEKRAERREELARRGGVGGSGRATNYDENCEVSNFFSVGARWETVVSFEATALAAEAARRLVQRVGLAPRAAGTASKSLRRRERALVARQEKTQQDDAVKGGHANNILAAASLHSFQTSPSQQAKQLLPPPMSPLSMLSPVSGGGGGGGGRPDAWQQSPKERNDGFNFAGAVVADEKESGPPANCTAAPLRGLLSSASERRARKYRGWKRHQPTSDGTAWGARRVEVREGANFMSSANLWRDGDVVFFDTSLALGVGIDEGVLISTLEPLLLRLTPGSYAIIVTRCLEQIVAAGDMEKITNKELPSPPRLSIMMSTERLLANGEAVSVWLVKVTT